MNGPLSGDSTDANVPAVKGTASATEVTATGTGFTGVGVSRAAGVGVSGVGGGVGVEGNSESGSGIYGSTGNGIGVEGSTINGTAIQGFSKTGVGVRGVSVDRNGVEGRTDAVGFVGAVAGIAENSDGTEAIGVFGQSAGKGAGLWGISKNGEGIHGETNSTQFAAVAGIQLNPDGTGAGMYAENRGKGPGVVALQVNPEGGGAAVYADSQGKGPGVFGKSKDGEGVHGETNSATAAAVVALQVNPEGGGAAVYADSQGKGPGVFGKSKNWEGVHGETNSATAAAVAGIQFNHEGTGAGIYGETRGKGPAGFFRGDVLVTGDIQLINADCAEDFDIAGLDLVEPGTVMVIDSEGALRQSDRAYDKRVAGVISGAGGYKPGLILDKQESSNYRMPIALMGKVYCKVDAQFAAIEVGDLLTTSSTPGYAMKVSDPIKAFGTVIGKALRPLETGQGMIPILIALQ